jgi:hypothetical protein
VDIGNDEAGRVDHHARSQRALHLLGLAGHAEKAAEDRIVEERIALHHLCGVHVHDRRLHPLYDRRVGEPKFRR